MILFSGFQIIYERVSENLKEVKQMKSKFKKIILAILVLVLVFAASITFILRNEISTLMSIEQVRVRNDEHLDGSVYTMDVSGGFYLEDFIAQGGVSNDQELIDFIVSHLTHGLVDIQVKKPNIGCSSFTAVAENGDQLFGRNYDFSKTNTMIVRTKGNGERHSTLSTSDLQFMDIDAEKDLTDIRDKVISLAAPYTPIDGINDAGVSCGIYMTYQGMETVATDQQTEKPDITSTTLLRLILDYADDIEEAIDIAKQYDLHDSANTSFHYMVSDASGRSAILEWVGKTDATDNDGAKRELVVTYNDQDEYIGKKEGSTDYQVITNFIIQPGYYDEASSKKTGLDRYEKIYEELDARNGVVKDEKDAMSILEMVGRRTWKNDDKNGCTVHSVVYNNTKRSMLWVPNENFDDPDAYFEFNFD